MKDLKAVFIHSNVLAEVLQLATKYLGAGGEDSIGLEVSGFLLGFDLGDRIVIQEMVTGEQEMGELHVTPSEEFLAKLATDISAGKVRGRIFGWFHSHPGIGLFLSSTDVNTLKNMQRLSEDAFALVVDPLARHRFKSFRYDFATEKPFEIQPKEFR